MYTVHVYDTVLSLTFAKSQCLCPEIGCKVVNIPCQNGVIFEP